MASDTVDPIDWSHTPPSWAPELHVLHGVNAANKSQDLLHQLGLEHASMGKPDQNTACAAAQGMKSELSVLDISNLSIRSKLNRTTPVCVI